MAAAGPRLWLVPPPRGRRGLALKTPSSYLDGMDEPGVTTADISAALWEAVKLLTGADGLAPEDHLARTEVLHDMAKLVERARDGEAQLAIAGGWSYAEVGRALGVTKQAAFQRLTNLAFDREHSRQSG